MAAITAPGPPAPGSALDEPAGLLRLATAGSVDDGKSTLIGRLLHDAGHILDDQLDHLHRATARRGGGAVDLALLTDGLRAEREQGITIDVAYRYFATPRRSFILADTPGHEQYTRNMVTGASTAELSLILVDARKGLLEQTRRHAAIAALLGLPHVVLCVNKMDLVEHREDVFASIAAEFADWARRLGLGEVTAIPVSALRGDNVVLGSELMPWYAGPTLLEHLEAVELAIEHLDGEARLPIQWVIRPQHADGRDYRAYAGQLAGGALRPGDEVVVLPGGRHSRILAIDTFAGELAEAGPPLSIAVRLEDEIDVGRGELLCPADAPATVTRELEADLCWFGSRPLREGGRYALKHTTRTVRAAVRELRWRLDVTSLEHRPADALSLNDIGRVRLRLGAPLAVDAYADNRTTGSFILIDEATNETVAGGMIAGV